MSGFQTTLAFYTDSVFKFSPQNNSYLFVYLGIISLIIQGYLSSHKSKDIHGYAKAGIIIYALGLGLIAISPNIWMLFIAIAISSIGSSLFNVFLPTLLSHVDSHDPEGEIMGAYEGVSSLGRVVGPALFGSLIIIMPRPIYLIAAVFTVAVIYYYPAKQTN